MKVRAGFVSNSSSSSFIIRGMKLSTDTIIKVLEIPQDEIDEFDDNEYDLFDFLSSKLEDDFSIEVDGNYFGGRDFSTLIVGESIGSLEDGDVMELPDRTLEEDSVLIKKFEKFGFHVGELTTYIQMVSNDNY
jgi:hypothetical protein